MDYETAKLELMRHAGTCDHFHEEGFVGSLRPYIGLRDHNFHAVVESLLTLGKSFPANSVVERDVVESMFRITVFSRRWAIDEDGMLVRNNLITTDDQMRLRQWIEIIEGIALNLLAGQPPHAALHAYCEYVAEHSWGENFAFFMPLLKMAIEDEQFGDQLQAICHAIIRLGENANPTADALLQARQRNWNWYEPQERCTAEMLGYLDKALLAIGISKPTERTLDRE